MSRHMHQKITCRAQVLIPTTAGEQQESYKDIAVVWAEVTVKSSGMRLSARQNHITSSHKVRLRYQDKLLATRKILWQGREYRVVSLLNADNKKRILEFEIVEDHP